MVKAILLKGQRGFTLIELMAVIAILTILAGIVAGGVTGLGASGQAAKLDGDRNTIAKAANRFATDAFPEAYPIKRPAELVTSPDCCPTVGVIDFGATLPQDPTRKFVPKYLARIPDSAGLVSWRVDTATGKVFAADEAANLVLPSTAELDVAAAVGSAGSVSDYTLALRMKKNEAALNILNVEIPAGYSIGGASIPAGTLVGSLAGKFHTDNPWRPGQEIIFGGTLLTTSQSHEWDLVVDPDVNTCGAGCTNADVLNPGPSTRTHKVKITVPTLEVGGELVLTFDRGTAPAGGRRDHSPSTATLELTLYGRSGNSPSGTTIITNPTVKKVYRWLAEEHTAIDPSAGGKDVFNAVAGNQAVVLQSNSLPVALAQSVTTPEDTPKPITLAGSDPEGDPLFFSVVAQPTHGTLSGTAPNLVYTPFPNYNGPDSFSFKVDDGMVASRAAKVDIAVSTNAVSIIVSPVNDAPLALTQSLTTLEDTETTIILKGDDGDPEVVQALTFILTSLPVSGTLSTVSYSSGGMGIASGQLPLTLSSAILFFQPALNSVASQGFKFRVKDNGGTANGGVDTSGEATVTINITPVNDAPVALAQSVTTNQATPLVITLTGSDVETAASLLTFTVSQPGAGQGSVSPTTGTGSPLSVTYTPATNFNGMATFTFTVSDGVVASAPATVSIMVVATVVTTAHVLLLADVDNAGTTALVNTLTAAGYAVTHRPAPEYTWDGTNPPLAGFDVVVHLNGATYFQPLPVSAQTALVNFVQNGGGFIGSQWNGFERAIGQQTAMNDLVLQLWPFPDNCGACNMTWTVVPGQEGHPVLAGIPSSFTFFADGHDANPEVQFAVNPSTRLMRSQGGGAGVIVREFGRGRVVNFSSAANYQGDRTLRDTNIQKLYINAVAWTAAVH